jgi:hypothetical protein
VRFKSHLITAAAVVTLAVIGTIMNSNQSVVQGAGGPTVTIDAAQLPLPVAISGTPSVNIANTPSVKAAQSGVWNVGISVSQANRHIA